MHNELNISLAIKRFHAIVNAQNKKCPKTLVTNNPTTLIMIFLIVAGTSGATTLPIHIANIVYQNKGTIIDINIEETPFTELAINSVNGEYLNMTCSEGLTKILAIMSN